MDLLTIDYKTLQECLSAFEKINGKNAVIICSKETFDKLENQMYGDYYHYTVSVSSDHIVGNDKLSADCLPKTIKLDGTEYILKNSDEASKQHMVGSTKVFIDNTLPLGEILVR